MKYGWLCAFIVMIRNLDHFVHVALYFAIVERLYCYILLHSGARHLNRMLQWGFITGVILISYLYIAQKSILS